MSKWTASIYSNKWSATTMYIIFDMSLWIFVSSKHYGMVSNYNYLCLYRVVHLYVVLHQLQWHQHRYVVQEQKHIQSPDKHNNVYLAASIYVLRYSIIAH